MYTNIQTLLQTVSPFRAALLQTPMSGTSVMSQPEMMPHTLSYPRMPLRPKRR